MTLTITNEMRPDERLPLLLTIAPRSAFREEDRATPDIASLIANLPPDETKSHFRSPLVVFDFRGAPNEITESLPWILPNKAVRRAK